MRNNKELEILLGQAYFVDGVPFRNREEAIDYIVKKKILPYANSWLPNLSLEAKYQALEFALEMADLIQQTKKDVKFLLTSTTQYDTTRYPLDGPAES